MENSTEGAVQHTQDLFLTSPLKICGEVELRIHQHLLGTADSLERIERVYSHAQSLGQCRQWLRKHLPNAERIAVASNGEAARRARREPESAAIAGETAAQVYGLKVLAPNIEDRPDNSTRFVVIGRELFAPSGRDKTSLLLAAKDQPGALYHLLDPFAKNGISMTRIESRPARGARWEYVFFVDIEGHVEDPKVKKALAELGPAAQQVKVLGSYPVRLF
jgi:chorismate mutase/prephenate dehydratase